MRRKQGSRQRALPVVLGCIVFLAATIGLRSQQVPPGGGGGGVPGVPTSNANPNPNAAAASPLDQPLTWLHDAKRNFATVRDYTCTLVSKERVNGRLQDDHTIQLKVRQQPFSVAMRWLTPRSLSNQEVYYVSGRNNNMLRARGHGLKKVAGFVDVPLNDPRVSQHSRHTPAEAGLGNLIDQSIKMIESERRHNKTQVRVAEYTFDNRPCYKVELIGTERRNDSYCFRSVLFLEKESKIPIRNENYDWPRAGGPPEGELLEMFSYVGLQFNRNLPDSDFVR